MNPGTIFANRYSIISSLGEGGMANVYLADDLSNNQQVAVKMLRLDLQENPEFVRRFQREAQNASKLVHPNIVQVLNSGTFDGIQYIVMEYIEGIDLKNYIREFSPIPKAQVVNIMEQILSAVSMAHNHGIVHRDLKPQNILIDKNGSVKITDFGIAIARSEFGMTQTNSVLGSIHYLSPEQIRGGMATNKSDIYSLGVILYEMLIGKVPYEGNNTVSIALKHSNEEMPSLRKIDETIPQPLENVVLRATAKNPDNRYLTAEDMANDLRTVLIPERASEARIPAFFDDQSLTKTMVLDDLNASEQTGTLSKMENNSNLVPKKGPQKKKSNAKLLAFLIPAGVLIFVGLLAFLMNMFGPKKITVDNLSNKTEAQARKILDQNGLKVGEITKVNSNSIDKGKIVKTDPEKGKRVRRGTKIKLFISNGTDKIVVGNYEGFSYDKAKKKLVEQGFEVKQKKAYSTNIAKGSIISQNINPDKKVKPSKTTIIFVVSKGQKKTEIPNLVGQTLEFAQTWAAQNNVVLESSQESSETVPAGQIISQDPNSGKIAEGSILKIVISSGSNSIKVLNFIGQDQNNAIAWAKENGISLRISEIYDSNPQGIVIAQSGGDKIEKNGSITITVSKGPQKPDVPSSSSSSSSSNTE
ncbi:MAG: Stk1 family PASTA domain-containing Ser/Thr kinase [Lactobacillaceae bacterium]|jgi:serine/threonine-protein kinase|nr:Stk1 family PASTA domain-containing Ser/Thr kinase [Lactobacillaceae bacterium]